jgi:uncharacterized protein YoxC
MENFINEIGITNTFIILLVLIFVLLILVITFMCKTIYLDKKYKKFMKKLGESENLEEDLENYMYKVERVEKQNAEILGQLSGLDKDLEGCIQKVGIVRYSAFQDTGSDLSFSLALLDEKNNGVVMNGIYSREMSNIYAKPVEAGNSSYTLSEEEQQAIKKAMEVGKR